MSHVLDQQQILGFLINAARVSLWLFLLVVIFVPLERLFALNPKKFFTKATLTDVGFYFVSGLVPSLLLAVPLSLLAWGAHEFVPWRVQNAVATMPFWPRATLSLVVSEIGYYWGHRWTHQMPLLWRFHSVHHSVEQLYFLSSSHAHPVDNVFVRLCGFVPLYALGFASVSSVAGNLIPVLLALFTTVWGFFIHANIRVRLGPLEWLFTTPAFHHWHHTIDEHRDHNFAANLPFIDRLFGTHYLPKEWPPAYGIETKLPASLGGKLMHPFRLADPQPVREPEAAQPENLAPTAQ